MTKYNIGIECYDNTLMKLTLNPYLRKIGVFVSGGLDSALLYFLLTKINVENNYRFQITPFSMLRKEGSPIFAPKVISYINTYFGIPYQNLNVVGDNTLPEHLQVESGIKEVFNTHKLNLVYLGIINNLEEHLIGWKNYKFVETPNRKYPLLNLNKSHVVDLIVKLNQEHLFTITHSCVYAIGRCGICNGCRERQWGFDQSNIKDIGID